MPESWRRSVRCVARCESIPSSACVMSERFMASALGSTCHTRVAGVSRSGNCSRKCELTPQFPGVRPPWLSGTIRSNFAGSAERTTVWSRKPTRPSRSTSTLPWRKGVPAGMKSGMPVYQPQLPVGAQTSRLPTNQEPNTSASIVRNLRRDLNPAFLTEPIARTGID